jgi:uncharacterized delta-60 repeat protein
MVSARFSIIRSIASLAILVAALATSGRAQSTGYGDGYDPNTDANVYAMVRQPDGKVIVGGSFTLFEPDHYGNTVTRQRIARINRDGTIDTSFTTYTDGDISALALQPDGRILIAGKFTVVGNAAGWQERNGVARLNADGSLDTSFVQVNPVGFGPPPYINYPQAIIRTIAVQADGRILIGGAFSSLQPTGSASPITRTRLARLNADGTVDTTFDVAANNTVLALLIQPDGRIVVGGGFTTIRPNGATTAESRGRIARLNADGTLESGFAPAFDDRVLALARQADGKLLVGGEFTLITPVGVANAQNAGFVARLNADGSHDAAFAPSTSAAVESISIQTDGRIILGGRFTSVRSSGSASVLVYTYVARLFMNGELDTSFFPNANAPVTASIVQPDGSILLGGYFSTMGSGSGGNARRGRIARVLADGSLDVAFRSSSAGSVLTVAEEASGSLIVAGSYAAIGGVTRYSLSRISPDGTVSATFKPEINGAVFAVRPLSDGRILIGGSFSRVNGVLNRYIARLSADGTLDTTFNPDPNASVYTIALQSDGKILVGGAFNSLQPDATKDAVIRRYIARLNADATVDTTFDPSPNLTVNSIVVQSDGKILAGGDFYTLQPNGAKKAVSYYYIVRLNTDGTPDDTFQPRPNAAVARVFLQSDGKVVFGGSFTSVLPGKDTTATPRRYIARANADGTLDTGFDPGPDGPVYSIDQYSDGRFVIHGAFKKFQAAGATTWTDRPYLAWLTSTGALDTTRVLTPDAALSVSKVMSSGATMVGSAFTRLTDSAGQVTVTTDILTRVASAGTIDPSFQLNPGSVGSSYVGALAQQVGGKIYTAGSFSNFGGSANSGVARFHSDGVPDNAFSTKADGTVHAVIALEASEDEEEEGGPVAWLESSGEYRTSFDRTGSTKINGTVSTLAVQSDGMVLVGGEFAIATTVTTTTANHLARLKADGTLDETFLPKPNAAVWTLATLSDGRMIIGGKFTEINGTSHTYLARLLPTGALDTAWAPTPNGAITQVVPMSDGSVYVAGEFSQFKPNGATSAVSRAYVARIKADGTVDTEFNPEANARVNRVVPLSDGKLLLGGAFTTIKGKDRAYLARVDDKGALDTAFFPKPNGVVSRIALSGTSGAMVVAGEFSEFEPNDAGTIVKRSLVARINADGTVEADFHPFPNNYVEDVAVHSDGSIVLAGSFTAFRFEEGGAPTRRNYIARFLANGAIDPVFNPNANGTINVVNQRSDGSMLIGGSFNQLRPSAVVIVGGEFTNIAESPTPYLARLNDDGSIDTYYAANPDAPVRALGEQSDGSLLVGGDFTRIARMAQARLARLDSDGNLDGAFAPTIDGPVYTLAVQADDRVLIGGEFATVGGASRTRLARLLAGGAVDSSFNASVDVRVSAIAIQPDGRILLGGAFTQVNGTGRSYLARLAADGTLDASFAPVLDGAVRSIAVQADGGILIGGAFTQVGGVARARLARLAANGTLDTSFTTTADGDVRALMLMADGRVIGGGSFVTFGGRRQFMVGRVANPTAAVHTGALDSGLTTFTWTSSGAAATFSSVALSTSENGQVWTNLGDAVRTSTGAWQLTGITGFGATRINHLRARAVHATNSGGSAGRFEITWAFYGSTLAGPASLLNSGGATAGWTGGAGGSGDGSGSSGGSGGTGGSGGSTGGGSGGTGGSGSGGGTTTTAPEYHLINLSIRAWPEDGSPFIAGLVLSGQSEGRVLLRAVGPGLTRFGVDPVMSEPRMTLFDSTGSRLSTSASWTGDATVAATATAVGAFALDPTSDDSAVVRTLSPGAYTIHVDSGNGFNGVALGEVYYASDTGGLANFSARAQAGAGTAATIAGFVVGGDQPRRLLLRGVGPALAKYGVGDAAPDPSVRVYDAAGRLIAANDDWQVQAGGGTAVEIASAAATVRAFALPLGSKDAAVVVELPPGAYTVHVGGAVAGTVLAEVYEIP